MQLQSTKANYADCYEYLWNKIFTPMKLNLPTQRANWPGFIGLEVETFIFNKSEHLPGILYGRSGFSHILNALATKQQWSVQKIWLELQPGQQEEVLFSIDIPQKGHVSFEPGAQLEFSTSPKACLNDADEALTATQQLIKEALATQGLLPFHHGNQPWHHPDVIGLQLKKKRYLAMNNYFSRLGVFGKRMMRQTASVQVNLDYSDDDEMLVKRFILAQCLAPYAVMIFANSPYCDGALGPVISHRQLAWEFIDPKRTGILPQLAALCRSPDKKTCVQTYLDFALTAPVIYIEALDYQVPEHTLSFAEWLTTPYQKISPTLQDFATHLSLLFPEVRPKGFLEFRSIDAQAPCWQIIPALFYSGLFYDEKAFAEAYTLLTPQAEQSAEKIYTANHRGFNDTFLQQNAKNLMAISKKGLSRLPSCYSSSHYQTLFEMYDKTFTQQALNPAMTVVQAHGDKQVPQYNILVQLQELWEENISKNRNVPTKLLAKNFQECRGI